MDPKIAGTASGAIKKAMTARLILVPYLPNAGLLNAQSQKYVQRRSLNALPDEVMQAVPRHDIRPTTQDTRRLSLALHQAEQTRAL
jgi:hypothetical protein